MEQIWLDVCCRDPTKPGQPDACIFELAVAFGRGFREDQWRAVDHGSEFLERFVTKRRDRKAALKFLRKTMKRHGNPHSLVTDKLRSYCAAMKVGGNADRQETGHWKIIEPGIHIHCLAVVCLQATRRGRFGDENAPCCGSDKRERYRNSSPYTPQSTTISTKKDIYIHGPISSSTAPPHLLSGVS